MKIGNWREIPSTVMSWALNISIAFFLTMMTAYSVVQVFQSGSWGMLEGMSIGSSLTFAVIMTFDKVVNKKENARNEKVKLLMREAHHTAALAEQFQMEGNQEAFSQFANDHNKVRVKILGLLSGELDPKDV